MPSDGSKVFSGSATQFVPGRWLTAAHVVAELGYGGESPPRADIREVWLVLGSTKAPAQVVFCDPITNVAVLSCTGAHPWTARLASRAELNNLNEGALVRIVGWVGGNEIAIQRPAMRVFYDEVTQTFLEHGWLFVTGQIPHPGMSGGPAIALNSGRVIGIVCAAQVADASGVQLVGSYVVTLGTVPARHLR